MRLFLGRVFCFGVLVLCVMGLLEKLIAKKQDEYSYKHNYIEQHLDEIKILSLGHSHIADGIDMIALNDSGFNTAIPSRVMFYDMCIVDEFVPQMKKLKVVILPLGYNFQYRQGPDASQKFGMKKYWGYVWPGESAWKPELEIVGGSKRKILELLGMQERFDAVYDSLGHQRLSKKMRRTNWDLSEPVGKGVRKTKLMFISQVKEIAAVCNRYGVRLIVVTTPTWKSYYDKTTSEGRAELYEIVDSMRSVCPDIEYYNYMNDGRFMPNDFFDASHLNEDGALKFTAIIKQEVLSRKKAFED